MTTAAPGSVASVAILAGSGELPLLLAERLSTRGTPCRVMAFRGFCDRRLLARADAVVGLLDLRSIMARLETWAPAVVTLAGGLARPSAAALVDAYSAYRNRDEVAAIVARGDDNLLRGAVDLLERRGHRLVGIRDLAPELLAPAGAYGSLRPGPADEAAIACGFGVIEALSRFDIGQAVVVAGERVLAVEGPEGTDRMLSRVRPARRWLRPNRAGCAGALVKGPKRGQDLRVDLPAIGPRTVANAARAGLAGIAVASGLTLVVRREETIAAADRLGLFVVGCDAGREDAPVRDDG